MEDHKSSETAACGTIDHLSGQTRLRVPSKVPFTSLSTYSVCAKTDGVAALMHPSIESALRHQSPKTGPIPRRQLVQLGQVKLNDSPLPIFLFLSDITGQAPENSVCTCVVTRKT